MDRERWREFLTGRGAVFAEGAVIRFGAASARDEAAAATIGDVLADLSHLGLLAATGADAARFLQSQVTADLAALDASHTTLAALCNTEGRVAAVLRLWRRGAEILLEAPVATLDDTGERLRRYLFRSDVGLADVSGRTARLGLAGPGAEAALGALLGGAPGRPGNAVSDGPDDGALTVLRLPGPQPRFTLHAPAVRLRHVWARLAVRARPVGRGAWGLLDIAAGIPSVCPPNVEVFMPQMLGLDVLGAVSFGKGCYLGQEAVATLQDRGRLPRRLLRARVDAPVPAPGTPLLAPPAGAPRGPGDAREEGRVVAAAPDTRGGCELLAVVRVGAERGELRLGAPDGPPLTVLPLPPLPPAATAGPG